MTAATAKRDPGRTKLYRPDLPTDYIPRLPLLQAVRKVRHLPLVLISAPAGYGKTTMLSGWLEGCEWRKCWLSLDESDSDLIAFACGLLTTVRTQWPDFGRPFEALLNASSQPSARVLARSFGDELAQLSEHLIIALDDYHVVADPAVHEFVDEVLRHPPPKAHFVMGTRRNPPLALARLRARGQLAEFRADDLRFTIEESRQFVAAVSDVAVPPHVVAAIEQRTEGWPAGLRLAALTLRDARDLPRAFEAVSQDGHLAMDFLLTEILGQLDPHTQTFLMRTSVLDRLSAPLCDAVTLDGASARSGRGALRGQVDLERLLKANLFIVPMDDSGTWFRYHQLFRDLLRKRLQAEMAKDEIARLHRRAGRACRQLGLFEEALHHALAGDDFAGAIAIVAAQRHVLINNDEWARLGRWLRLFPQDLVDGSLELTLTKAWLCFHMSQRTQLQAVLDKAAKMPPPTALPALQRRRQMSDLAVLQAYVHFWGRDYQQSDARARECLTLAPRSHWQATVMASLLSASAHVRRGEAAQAIDLVNTALARVAEFGPGAQARAMVGVLWVLWSVADLNRLAEASRKMIALAQAANHSDDLSWGRYFLGIVHYHRNELSEAERLLDAVVSSPYTAYTNCFVQAACALALTHQARQEHARANAVAEMAAAHLFEIGNQGFIPIIRALQALLALQQGRTREALRAADLISLPGLPLVDFFLPHLALARIRMADVSASGRATAGKLLDALAAQAEAESNPLAITEVLAVQAVFMDSKGRRDEALALVSRALALAEPDCLVRVFANLGPGMGRLLGQLQVDHVATDYVGQILDAIAQTAMSVSDVRQRGLDEPLTNRELEVLALLGRRLSDKEIAQALMISPGTVKRHTHNIFQKLFVSNRREAVNKAAAIGILTAR